VNAQAWALISVALCALVNIITKEKLSTISPLVTMVIQSMMTGLIMGSLVVYDLKKTHAIALPRFNQIGWVVLVGLLTIGATYTFLTAYQMGGDVIFVTNASALVPVLVAIFAFFVLGTKITLHQITAVFMAVSAIILSSYSPK